MKIIQQGDSQKISWTQEVKGLFSLSNAIINLARGRKRIDAFMNKVYEALEQFGLNKEEDISVGKQLDNWNNHQNFLLPIENMDYLVRTGTMIQLQLGNLVVANEKERKVEKEIKRYWELLGESLDDYDKENATRYREGFEACPLIMRLKNENLGLLQMLVERIRNISQIESKAGSDDNWNGDK